MPDEHTYGFNKTDAEAIIQGVGVGEKIFPELKPIPLNLFRTVVLDEALDAATNALTAPGTATASVLEMNSGGDYVDSGKNVTVTNRNEHVSLVQYTICIVTWLNAEWRVTSADCDALGDWP